MKCGRILFLITGLAYAGAETQLARLAINLKAKGWQVRIISMTRPKGYVAELEAAGIPVASLEIQRNLPDPRPIIQLAKTIRTWQPDIVHSFMVHANLFARLVRLISPVPLLICSARSTDEGGKFREFLYRLTDPLCDLTTQVSHAGLDRYIKVNAVPRSKICFMPNGIDTTRFYPDHDARMQLREDLGIGNAFVWIAIGRFNMQKDYPNMLIAFSYVIRVHPDVLLIIVGDGLLRPSMEELARNLGIKDKVKFLGIRHDIQELMNAADAYVMSSSVEGMANVLLEASATGLPIVATDVGGNSQVVQDGKTGFLVHPKDHQALGRVMVRLLGLSERERRQMGRDGCLYTEKNYSLDQVVGMWEMLYQKLLSDKRNKRSGFNAKSI